jgi:hypothetical protein
MLNKALVRSVHQSRRMRRPVPAPYLITTNVLGTPVATLSTR